MAKLNYLVLAHFSALTLCCCVDLCPAQDSIHGDSAYGASLQGQTLYRGRVASVSQELAVEPRDHAATGEFPALIVPESEASDKAASAGSLAGPVVTTISSLVVVLAVFGGLVWISRRYGSARTSGGALPEDVLSNLGSAAIDAKTRVTFLRVGTRILVIGQTQNGEPQTLSEITDPDEVSRLTSRCLGRPEIVGRRNGFSSGTESSRRDLAAG